MTEGRPIETNGKLDKALVAAQELDKKLRGLRNKGEATEADVDDAKAALGLYRAIARRHGIRPVDIDSRGERARD